MTEIEDFQVVDDQGRIELNASIVDGKIEVLCSICGNKLIEHPDDRVLEKECCGDVYIVTVDRRALPRKPARCERATVFVGVIRYPVTLIDLSETGAGLQVSHSFFFRDHSVGKRVTLLYSLDGKREIRKDFFIRSINMSECRIGLTLSL